MQLGGFGPAGRVGMRQKHAPARQGKARRKETAGDSLEDTLDGHDGLDEQRLSVVHVPVQESHECDSLMTP